MKAVLCKSWGGPETLVIEDVAEPVPGPGEALVRVTAASLNFMDTLIIEKRYQLQPELPFSPASEIAGVVERLGSGVAGPPPGSRVTAYLGYGGAREKVCVAAERLALVPDAVSDGVAASLQVAYGTTLHAFKQRANLKAGETLAVLGASGGVGQAAIELGKVMGARVIAAASGAKLDWCRALGADEVIDYETEDLRERLRRFGGPKGVDVVYDAVGDRFSEPALRSMAWGGRFLVIGFAAGEIPRLPLNLVLLKGCAIIGVFWGRFIEEDPAACRANTQDLLVLAASGQITPRIQAEFPLDRAGEAIALLAARKVTGKLILTP